MERSVAIANKAVVVVYEVYWHTVGRGSVGVRSDSVVLLQILGGGIHYNDVVVVAHEEESVEEFVDGRYQDTVGLGVVVMIGTELLVVLG